MNDHEKTINLLSDLGMTAKKAGIIIGKSQSVVYDKIKQYNYNKFSAEDYEKLVKHCQKIVSDLH